MATTQLPGHLVGRGNTVHTGGQEPTVPGHLTLEAAGSGSGSGGGGGGAGAPPGQIGHLRPTAPGNGGGTGGGGGNPPPTMNHRQESAFDLMRSTLQAWGLGSLIGELRRLIVAGDTSADMLTLKLRETNAYKQRFAGNEMRIANGLAPLSEADYLSTESSYQQVLSQYGLPRGFYDQHSDFADFIGKNVSAAELSTRAQVAHDQFMSAPAAERQLWTKYFGISQGDVIAGILDPNRATQVIQDRATQVGIGGAAAEQGLSVAAKRAKQLQEAGVDITTARNAYAQIAASLPTDQSIAQRFGTTFGQTQEENDLLLNRAAAGDKRNTLYAEEKGLFNESVGNAASTFGVAQNF